MSGADDAEGADVGSAIIEFVFAAVIVLVPLVYLIVAVADVQRSQFAVSEAAREAGRAFATSNDPAEAQGRARAAADLTLRDQGLPTNARLTYVAAGASCKTGHRLTPQLTPGARFTVCVLRHQGIPAVPTAFTGGGITSIGEYVVYVDDYRSVP